MGSSNRASWCSLLVLAIFSITLSDCATDPSDAQGLQVLFAALNNPSSQLSKWKSSGGGDPCGESWEGVTCQGPAVVSIQISGLGLTGTMGYSLTNFLSLKTLDMSANNIHDQIPYQLPPNLTSLNLANNNLSGSLPYSLSSMTSLTYLNVSRNSLSSSVGDIFTNLVSLVTLDLSVNNFTSDLPISVTNLSNLSTFHVQDNHLTGSLSLLSGLPLTDLNVADNHFNGSIPKELLSIPTFIYGGNSFDNAPPGRGRTHPRGTSSGGQSEKRNQKRKEGGLAAATIIGIVVATSVVFLLALLALLFCVIRNGKHKEFATGSGATLPVVVSTETDKEEMQEQMMKSTANVADLKPIIQSLDDPIMQSGKKRVKSPIITSSAYTVASLQTATNSFTQDNLIGEGSLGRVYKGLFPNGKIVAVKKIDNAALSLQEEDNFVEAISNMSRLRHPNINTLVGYCSEHGQRLLVYDYVSNGSLHDMLHFADENSKLLTWNARVRVALGTSRALEYLHEVCLPSVVHRNFKSANILLDDDLNPHVSDCGLAALTLNTERQVSSAELVGAFGYSAPECALSGIYTVKSDVYSFGVVMLELLTGRKPLDSSRVRGEQSLVRWATPQLHDIDSLSRMVDPALNGMYPAKSLSRFADIIALCVQAEPEFRPPMSEVVQALVRLMQRASAIRRHSSDGSGFMYKPHNQDTPDT